MLADLKTRIRSFIQSYLWDETHQVVRRRVFFVGVFFIQSLLLLNLFQRLWFQSLIFFKIQAERQNLATQIRVLKNEAQTIEKQPQAVENLLQSLPESRDRYAVLSQIQDLAAEKQLVLGGFAYDPPLAVDANQNLWGQNLKLNLRGRFEDFLDFLKELNQLKQPIVEQSLDLETSSRLLTTGVVNAQINLKTFFLERVRQAPGVF